MSETMMVVRLQAAAEMASAASLPTSLKLCSDGIEVETWSRGRRISKTVPWADVKYAYANPVVAAINSNIQEIDACTTTGAKDEWMLPEVEVVNDAINLGIGITKDGKRVDPRDFYKAIDDD